MIIGIIFYICIGLAQLVICLIFFAKPDVARPAGITSDLAVL